MSKVEGGFFKGPGKTGTLKMKFLEARIKEVSSPYCDGEQPRTGTSFLLDWSHEKANQLSNQGESSTCLLSV